jgi:ABC-type branched-subunit amino acid transport system substrate-binding protein
MLVATVAAVAMLAAACGAQGDDAAGEEESTATTEATDDGGTSSDGFGDMESPCGDGDYQVEAAEAAGATDKLLIGVTNDRTSQIRNGLNKEMWDASNAFVAWCNEQGGIGGLPIEIVDIDGQLLQVESAMTKACAGVFMLAGGGMVQDNLQFSGKPESDFHLCRLAEIPGYAVAPEKAESNGQIQPLPHPASLNSDSFVQAMVEVEGEAPESAVVVWGDLPAMETVMFATVAAFESQGVEVVDTPSYNPVGENDWTPLAQKVIDSGAEVMSFVGEPTNFGTLMKTLREQGWTGKALVETNMYDQTYLDSAGEAGSEGTLLRSVFHPFEEADQWPAVQQFVDIVEENVDDPKVALLGMQSFSAWLLFATAANDCAESNDGVLTRGCILEAAAEQDEWTAGGLHAATDPGPEGGTPSDCVMLLVVEDGAFERLYPEVGGEGDDGEGFFCPEGSLVDVPENEGLGVVSPDQPI